MVQGVWLLDGNVVLLTVPPCACRSGSFADINFILEYCKILFLKVSFKHDIFCDGGIGVAPSHSAPLPASHAVNIFHSAF